MRALVVGGGSMGQRRLRDLTHLIPGAVSLLEPIVGRAREVSQRFGVPFFEQLADALQNNFDAIVICTPPALHDGYVQRAIEHKLHIFAEVPFSLNRDTLQGLRSGYSKVIGISHTIRYYPPCRILHDRLQRGDIGAPLYLEYSLGNYLPDWHPYESYRSFYAQDERLGGAGLDMILHEIAPIQWWVGPIRAVQARLSKLSRLEVNGPDNHDILFAFDCGKGYLHHDIIEQGTVGRHVRISGEEGTMEWHQDRAAVRLYSGRQRKNEDCFYETANDWPEALAASRIVRERMAQYGAASGVPSVSGDLEFTYESCYYREMAHFVAAVRGETEYSVSPASEDHNVRVFDAIRESNEKRSEVRVDEVSKSVHDRN